jgi:uncharacterized protein YegP (UPF0339 family)
MPATTQRSPRGSPAPSVIPDPIMTRTAQSTQAPNTQAEPNSMTSEPTSMTLLIFEDNAGRYRWTIVARSGETLVQSASFASYEAASQAARVVHAGWDRAAADAERWLDEGGSLSSEDVTREP